MDPGVRLKTNFIRSPSRPVAKMSQQQATLVVGPYRIQLKYLSLVTLALQNAITLIVMKYSRMPREGELLYLASTAVVMTEVFKFVTCILGVLYEQKTIQATIEHLRQEIFVKYIETLKLGIPAGLYTIQSNLIFLAVSSLDAATFQVTYQLKLLTTALFSVMMLGKRLTKLKWSALVVLMFGVALVQMQDSKPSATSKASANATFVGLVAVIIACFSSGFAGVYFEKLLKDSTATIFVRNIQLGFFGMTIGLIGAYWNDGEAIRAHGFFQGYTPVVWVVIFLQGVGGLLVAMCVKYADNILKGFATSVAIIISCIAAIFLFDFVPSLYFLTGASLVMLAVYMYSKPDAPPTQNQA
eukprot:Colp12_sorted_trinity150504_noHs@17798